MMQFLKKSAVIIIIPMILISCSSKEKIKNNVIQQFEQMSNAYLKGNIPVYVDFMYPKVIERAGGRDSTIKLIYMIRENLKIQGRQIRSIKQNNISEIVKAGKELHCVVTETIEIERQDGKDIVESNILAVSDNKGKDWKFLEVSGANIGALKKLFPEFNTDLKFPETKAPSFVPNQK